MRIKKYVFGLDMVLLYVLSAGLLLTLSYLGYRAVNVNRVVSYAYEDMSMHHLLHSYDANPQKEIMRYLSDGSHLFYGSDDTFRENMLTNKEYCNRHNIIILNGKNFQEVNTDTLTTYEQISFDRTNKVYIHHCFNKFVGIDSYISRIY